MKLRSGLLGLTLTSVVAFASANAADMYRAPAAGGYKDGPAYVGVNWSGFYVGANGGYGWNDHSDAPLDPAGGFGGGQIGYNWQGAWHPNLVFGIEADFQGAGISDTVTLSSSEASLSVKSELEWFGTVRARAGYTFGNALLYGTGGFAYGSVKGTLTARSGGASGSISNSKTETGWVAGGGIEYKLSPSWSAKAEYQFLSLDASDGPLLGGGDSDRSEISTVRVGVNYFVGSGYEPLK
jgi:outer membrane immunogenic protein